jgi:hypothetical protein
MRDLISSLGMRRTPSWSANKEANLCPPPPVAGIETFLYTSAYVSIRQHTSAYVSIRQHTANKEANLCPPPPVAGIETFLYTSAYVSIRQHTLAYVSIRRIRRRTCVRRRQGSKRNARPLRPLLLVRCIEFSAACMG